MKQYVESTLPSDGHIDNTKYGQYLFCLFSVIIIAFNFSLIFLIILSLC